MYAMRCEKLYYYFAQQYSVFCVAHATFCYTICGELQHDFNVFILHELIKTSKTSAFCIQIHAHYMHTVGRRPMAPAQK